MTKSRLEMSEMEMRQIAGEINMCPSSSPGTVPNTDVLFQRIEELSRKGLAYITHRPLDHALGTTPADAVLDVFLILQGMPVLVLTLVMNKYQRLDKVSAYNLVLTDRIAKAFKEISPEQFSVVNGVLLESDIASEVHFENFIDNILKDNYLHLDLHSFVSDEKCKCIITTFLSSMVLTSSIVKDSCDALWFLSLQQFCMVTETIEKKAVIVKIKPSDGSKALLGDVVGTLKTLGSTFVVIESEEAPGSGEPTPAARGKGVCSFIMPLEEWRMRLTDATHFPGIIHVVVDWQGHSSVLNNITSWLFISDGAVQYGDDPLNYAEGTDQDVTGTTNNPECPSRSQRQTDARSQLWSAREWSKEDLLETIDEGEEDG